MSHEPAPSQGVLYIATGAKFIRAAVHSAKSVRRHCPGLLIHLHADWQRHGFDFGASPFPFTSVDTIERPHRRSKVDLMAFTPFEGIVWHHPNGRMVKIKARDFGI